MANVPDLTRASRGSLWDFMRDFDEIVSRPDLFGRSAFDNGIIQPGFEFDENENSYFMSFDLPGVKKEDIKIDVSQNMLSITGERKSQQKGEQSSERRYGRFQRSLTLPAGIDANQVQAHFENGVLELVVPKAEESRARSIEVQSGQGSLIERLTSRKDVASTDAKTAKEGEKAGAKH